jgi:proline dehydrogenase
MAGARSLEEPPDAPDEGPQSEPAPIPSQGHPNQVRKLAESQARAALLWLSRQQRLQRLTAEFGPARRMARRFVAGETREDAIAAALSLQRGGMYSTVAFLGEHTTDAGEARAAVEECARMLRALASAGLPPNISLKLTQLGLGIDAALAEEGLRTVLAVADEVDGFVRIDMESSDTVSKTLELFEQVSAGRPGRRVGVVIQSYLRRSEADVRRLVARGASVRLVKGAYAEPPEVAFPDKADVDASFARLARLLLSAEARATGVYPAFATHDPAMIAAVRRLARRSAAPPEAYEFQMLLGVRRDLQVGLAREGLQVRIYVPYGGQWYPYFMRRLAERPANLLFLLRSLLHR